MWLHLWWCTKDQHATRNNTNKFVVVFSIYDHRCPENINEKEYISFFEDYGSFSLFYLRCVVETVRGRVHNFMTNY